MRASAYTMQVQPEVRFHFAGQEPGEYEVAYPMIEIDFRFSPGCRAYTPRGEYAPIDPPEPPEVEFVSARLIDADGLDATPDRVEEWARDFLDSDEGFLTACAWVEYER